MGEQETIQEVKNSRALLAFWVAVGFSRSTTFPSSDLQQVGSTGTQEEMLGIEEACTNQITFQVDSKGTVAFNIIFYTSKRIIGAAGRTTTFKKPDCLRINTQF